MPATTTALAPQIQRPDRLYIGGAWVVPSSTATIEVVEAATETPFLRVAAAQEADVARAVEAARTAFDEGPWPRMTPAERADYLRALALGIRKRLDDFAQFWSRQSGIVFSHAQMSLEEMPRAFEYYAVRAADFEFVTQMPTRESPLPGGTCGLLVREPVGVVGAIIPWNGPNALIGFKCAPALLAGCTVVLKAAPEAPGEAYLMAEIADEVGLPAGVLNVICADREASEALVRDPRIDKISFTGSTAAGRRIGAICADRVARVTLELGGKSAAVILDDADIPTAAALLAGAECFLTGQVCASITRVIVTRDRHDDLVEAIAAIFASVEIGDPFSPTTAMGPLAMSRQRDRVEGYIARGIADGAKLAGGGKRPAHLDRGWFIEPTVFADVDNSSTIAQEEIFGPVLSIIPARDEAHAVELANDSIYGLNASVFTPDVERAYAVARRLRSGTVGHNAVRADFGIGFGGFKQSGIGREGGLEGLMPYLEAKTVLLDALPSGADGNSPSAKRVAV